jgi:hypothetical protein
MACHLCPGVCSCLSLTIAVSSVACRVSCAVCRVSCRMCTTKHTQASKPAEIDQFERLPDEVLLHLFSFLSSEASLAKAELVCRRWRRGTAHKVSGCGVVTNRWPMWVSCGGRATEPSGMEPRRRTQVRPRANCAFILPCDIRARTHHRVL